MEAATVEVSVILPVYNAAPWLPECLASLAAQIEETGEPFARRTACEVSIFDDSSTDESPKIITEWLPKLQVSSAIYKRASFFLIFSPMAFACFGGCFSAMEVHHKIDLLFLFSPGSGIPYGLHTE